MAAANYIAGHYTATWNAVDIGSTETGFNIDETIHVQQIQSDDMGDVPIDGIGQGVEVQVSFDYIQYDVIVAAMYAAQGATVAGTVATFQGLTNSKVGYTMAGLSKPLILTPVTGTPAQILDGMRVWTFPRAIIISNLRTLMASKLRRGPLTFHCYPDISTASVPYASYVRG